MLEALQFVQRGVARRDFVPGLTHFRIENRRVTGYNGSFAISAPVDIGFNIAPEAGVFMKALKACEEVIQLTLSADQQTLLINSGRYNFSIPCLPVNDVPLVVPEGDILASHESILEALAGLQTFIGFDASRPWATGVLLKGQSAFATNNGIIAEYWLGVPFPRIVNVPDSVVAEVVRVNEELASMQISDSSITFHYADGRWIKSQLLDLEWPDIGSVMQSAWDGSNLSPVPQGLADACETLTPFVKSTDAHLYFKNNIVSTTKQPERDTAKCELPFVPDGAYNVVFLNQVLEVATHVDFSKYPAPIPFMGHNLRGAMLGIRV